MTKAGKRALLWAVGLLFIATCAVAEDKGGAMPPGHGAMTKGGGMPGGGMSGGQGGMGMGDMGEKIGGGAFGPWKSAIHIYDARKALADAKAKGTKVDMNLSHHIMVMLLSKEGSPVLEGKGTVTVTGPGVKGKKYNLISMQGQFGSDLPLSKPGSYTLKISIQSGKDKGDKTVTATVK